MAKLGDRDSCGQWHLAASERVIDSLAHRYAADVGQFGRPEQV
jgi:hypothetical protein